ncbi:MAG: BatA domain-containing protein [Roseibacillus sp.]|nr:BatA domain-containing protein [Roseibacillus sp.]
MNFLNQALLWGIAAVSLPIIIHLLNRRRFRRVPWAAMRFLKVSVEQNQRRMRLEDWILLFLRCALVALLALLMARPMMEGLSGVPGSKVAAAIVLDNSASMGSREGEGTRLTLAREAAHAILDRLPGSSPVVVSGAFRPNEASNDHVLISSRIDEVPQTDRHADLLRALEEASRSLEGQAAVEKELYLITDGHAEEWGAFAALEGRLRDLSAGTKVHLVMVGSPASANLGISRLTPAAALPAVNQPFRIDVDITNYGVAPVLNVPVKLLVDGQPAGEPWMIQELKPGTSESATLYATLPSVGYHRVTVALEADGIPFDDQRTIVMHAMDDVRVLLVDGDPGVEDRESETFFLRHALAPVPVEGRADYPVKPSIVSVSDLAGEALDRYHAIILANVADVPLAFADRLARYVEAGGGLMVFPGGNLRPESYNTLLHSKHKLLPVSFVARNENAGRRPRKVVPTETNPLGLDGDLLSRVKFLQVLGLQTGDRDHRLALRYDDGTPALVESEYGQGKVFVFTSTADLEWNDFAIRPAFVPFVNRLLGGIVQNRESNLNIEAGETLRHRLDAALVGKEATVYEVGDPEALGRLTRLSDAEGSSVLEYGETDRGGAYQATIDGQPGPVLFAAYPSVRESSLSLLGEEQLGRVGDSAMVLTWGAESSAADFGADRKGSELWWPLLLVVIALAAIEIIFAQWFSRSK